MRAAAAGPDAAIGSLLRKEHGIITQQWYNILIVLIRSIPEHQLRAFMDIHFIDPNTDGKEITATLFPSSDTFSWCGTDGKEYSSTVTWAGPTVVSGFWNSSIEWIGKLDIAAIPIGIASGLLTNYLWGFIERWKTASAIPYTSAADVQSRSAAVHNVPTIVLIAMQVRLEIDPRAATYQDVESSVKRVLNEQSASQPPAGGNS